MNLSKSPKEQEKSLPTRGTDCLPPSIHCPTSIQRVLLVVFVIHFLGVLSEPLRFFSRSEVRAGPEFLWLGETMKPYSQWLYMNHGYFFFAPNPGPSHLIQCTTENPDQAFLLPSRDEHWPRLLYHRYFMLSEFYSSRYAPPQVSAEEKKDLDYLQRWATDKELYDQIQSSIVSSLKHSRNKENIELRRVERLQPDSQQVLKEGWTLNDPRLTSLLPETMIETALTAPVDVLPSKINEEVSR